METPAVSLLVAVYNTETYIRTCLESLRNQTMDNIEIIIVNDGSADASRISQKNTPKWTTGSR